MKVKKDEVIAMFKDLGYTTCTTWDDKRLTRKLNKLGDLLANVEDLPKEITDDMESKEPKLLVNRICSALDNDEKITLDGPETEISEGEETMATKTKEKKAKDKKRGRVLSVAEYEGREDKQTKKSKKEKTAKDKSRPVGEKKKGGNVNQFGYRKGTKSDMVDSVLTKKPMSVQEIAEASKCDVAFVRMHLTHAVENNRGVEKTDKGFRVTS